MVGLELEICERRCELFKANLKVLYMEGRQVETAVLCKLCVDIPNGRISNKINSNPYQGPPIYSNTGFEPNIIFPETHSH